MNKINYILSIVCLMILSFFSTAQVAVGQWRDHLPYNHGTSLAISENEIYMSTNAGLMRFDKRTSELEKLSKINGFSDAGVSTVKYSKKFDTFIIAYTNGNIDLVQNNTITNIGDLKRKFINGDKTIYDISLNGDFAYLACGFGIIELDLKRKEIKETWYIGENGTYVKINSLDNDGEYIYAATDIGIYKGNFNNKLVDFSNWEIITQQNLPNDFKWLEGKEFSSLTIFDGKIIANYHNPTQDDADTLVVYYNGNWERLYPEENMFEAVTSSPEHLILINRYWIRLLNKNFEEVKTVWHYTINEQYRQAIPADAFLEDEKILWIADKINGLVRTPEPWDYKSYIINGPETEKVYDFAVSESKIIGINGGMTAAWGPKWAHGMFFEFKDEFWTSALDKPNNGLEGVFDLTTITINPNDPNNIFIGSWVNGLLEYRNNAYYKIHNDENSSLRQALGNSGYIRIGGADFDSEGNLWVTNSLATPQIHVLDKQGKWTGINYSSIINDRNIGKILITKDNIKWVIVGQSGGLLVFDDNGTPDVRSDDKVKRLDIVNENGELISNDVYSIAEDKNGYIWVGTRKGVAVYYNPQDVFTSNKFTARQIKIPRNDGTDNADILLGNDVVTTITVDGSNKKWFGTQSGGVYYTSADGLEKILHFNTENSPLISNNIICTEIIPNTGEVFFGTEKGIISYRNIPTEGDDNFDKVYTFPNPVKPDYRGPITISGLVAGSYVKITDISGNLVFETRSEGGQAVWYGEDLRGNRVRTGVYLVFAANETGSKKNVTKILFISGNE
ncbi:MAG TPA: two-component regulator propeller domain-containing protein [Bacteroidales bacterium]|nr:two-component regulator propeller domain-containing protein [Bacteroidales bacterium]